MKIFLPILAVLLLCACAKAKVPITSPSPSASAASAAPSATVQRALAADGITIAGSLDAPAGFAGYLGSYQGHELPIYALPDGKHIVIGNLLDLDGHNLTAAALAGAAGSNLGEAQWKQLAAAHWFVEGNPQAKRIVYAFEDTRCPFCHQLWQESKPYIKQGNVQVRTLLVAVIAPESLPEGAKVMAAKDPAAAWNRNEENFGHNPPPGSDAPAAGLAEVRANTALFQQLGFMGTPSVVWKDAHGRIHAIQGVPRDKSALAAIFGG